MASCCPHVAGRLLPTFGSAMQSSCGPKIPKAVNQAAILMLADDYHQDISSSAEMTAAPRPNSVSLASCTASAYPTKVVHASTGPNTCDTCRQRSASVWRVALRSRASVEGISEGLCALHWYDVQHAYQVQLPARPSGLQTACLFPP